MSPDNIRFEVAQENEIGRGPVRLGDYNRDGRIDVGTSSDDPVAGLRILRNRSAPDLIRFSPAFFQQLTQRRAESVGRADFDGDGVLDLALIGGINRTISLFRSTSLSTDSIAFNFQRVYGIRPSASDVAVGDFDNDGLPDMAVAQAGQTLPERRITSLFRNRGGFALDSIPWNRVDGGSAYSLAAADLNGDDSVDFVIPLSNSNTVVVYKNRMLGTDPIHPPQTIITNIVEPVSVRLGDVDGDGDLDLALTSGTNNNISIFINQSTRNSFSFVNGGNFFLGNRSLRVEFGDLNGDGKPEILFGGINRVYFLTNLTTAQDTAARFSNLDSTLALQGFDAIEYFSTGDFDNDGRNDLAISGVPGVPPADGRLTVLRNITSPFASRFRSDSLQIRFGSIVVGDSLTIPLRVRNDGTLPLQIFSATAGPSPPFSIAPSTATISGGSFLNFSAKFRRSAAGPDSGRIVFFHNDTLRTQYDTVTVSGYGRLPAPQNVRADTVVARQIRWNAVRVPGSSFYRIFADTFQNPITLRASTAPNQPLDTSRTFAQLGIASNVRYYFRVRAVDTFGTQSDTSNQVSAIYRLGTFVFQAGDSLSFGSVTRGRDSIRSVIVRNTGTDTLRISSAQSNNPKFIVTPTTQINVPPSGSTTYSVRFSLDTSPGSLGPQSARIVFNHDALNRSDTLKASGRGILPPPDSLSVIGVDSTGVRLRWRAPPQSGVSRYFIYADPVPGSATTFRDSTTGAETTKTTSRGLDAGRRYNFRVTARDIVGGESGFSNQVDAVIPGSLTRVGDVSPRRAYADDIVTLFGSGFHSNPSQNAVYFGGAQADVLSAGPTSMMVRVPTGATYEPITVTNLQTNLTGYSAVPFQILYDMRQTTGSIRFNARADSIGLGRGGLALGEYDTDRNLDIAVAATDPRKGMWLYRNLSRLDTIIRAAPRELHVQGGGGVGAIARADFNGDGNVDLALLGDTTSIAPFGRRIWIFRNERSGTAFSFTLADSVPVLAGSDFSINDFDGDGKTDIAVANGDSGSIQLFKNNGTSFDRTPRRWSPLSERPGVRNMYSVATGDLNGDGMVDFVIPVQRGGSSDSIVVYKNRGLDSIPLFPPVLLRTSPGVVEVRLADIDGDGDLDVAVNSATGATSNVISIFMNIGMPGGSNIVLDNERTFPMTPRLGGIAFADLNGDGRPEILASVSNQDTIAYLQNLSTTNIPIFSGPYYLEVPNNFGRQGGVIRAGDIDKDGRPDLVAVGIKEGNSFGQSVVFRNTTTPVAPRFRGSPTQIAFSNVVRDTLSNIQFTVRNEGIDPLNVSATVIQSSQFSISPTSISFGEGERQFTATFAPTVVGRDSGMIIFSHNDVTHNLRDTVRVNGYGLLPAPQLQAPQIRDTLLGNVAVRWSQVSGAARYKVTYGITNPPVSDTASTTADSLRVNNLLTDSTYYFRVQAIDNFGTPSFFSNTASIFIPPPSFPFLRFVGATTLDFDTVVIGSSNTRNVVVRNTGLSPLTITSASIVNSDSFSVSPTSSPPLNYRDTQTFTVRFVPRHSGRANLNASLFFQHNGQGANSMPLRAVGRLPAPQNFRVVDRISGFMAVVVAWDTLRLGGVRRYITYRGLDPTNMERRSSVTTTRDTLGANTGTLYYYRVSAEDTAFGEGVRSPADTATSIAALQLPTPTGVTNPPGTLPPPISFFWNPVPGFGVRYQMQVRLSQTDTTTIVVDTSSVDTTFARFSQLAYNTTYYWRIRASAPGRQASAWGEAAQPFPTAAAKPLDIPAFNFSDSPLQTEYKLVGMPGLGALTFGELVQGTPKVDFKLYRELGDPSRNDFQFVDNLFEGLETGRGYWLLRKGSIAAKTKPGITMASVLTDRAVTIQKTRPWSIIASPFDGVDVRLQDIRAMNPSIAASEKLWDFTPEGWRARDTLKPFKGYYLYDSSATLKIPFPFPFPPRTEAPTQPFDWKIQMQLSSGGTVDNENFVGIAPAASVNRDSLESRKPPLVFENGYLYFARPEWDNRYSLFSEDYRPELGEGQVWNFEVSKPTKTDAQIVFRGLQTIPKEYEVALVNEANTIPARLREDSVYSFTIVKPKMPFKFIVGTKEFVENELSKLLPTEFALSQNYPNPFNPSTSIAYALAKKSSVKLEIYNLLGQQVKTLVNDEQARAFYTVVWNGTNDQNLQVATGIYFYRLVVNGSPFATKKMILTR
jgi:hypothetical protein